MPKSKVRKRSNSKDFARREQLVELPGGRRLAQRRGLQLVQGADPHHLQQPSAERRGHAGAQQHLDQRRLRDLVLLVENQEDARVPIFRHAQFMERLGQQLPVVHVDLNVVAPQPELRECGHGGVQDPCLGQDRLGAHDIEIPLVVFPPPALAHLLVAEALRDRPPFRREEVLADVGREHPHQRRRDLRRSARFRPDLSWKT